MPLIGYNSPIIMPEPMPGRNPDAVVAKALQRGGMQRGEGSRTPFVMPDQKALPPPNRYLPVVREVPPTAQTTAVAVVEDISPSLKELFDHGKVLEREMRESGELPEGARIGVAGEGRTAAYMVIKTPLVDQKLTTELQERGKIPQDSTIVDPRDSRVAAPGYDARLHRHNSVPGESIHDWLERRGAMMREEQHKIFTSPDELRKIVDHFVQDKETWKWAPGQKDSEERFREDERTAFGFDALKWMILDWQVHGEGVDFDTYMHRQKKEADRHRKAYGGQELPDELKLFDKAQKLFEGKIKPYAKDLAKKNILHRNLAAEAARGTAAAAADGPEASTQITFPPIEPLTNPADQPVDHTTAVSTREKAASPNAQARVETHPATRNTESSATREATGDFPTRSFADGLKDFAATYTPGEINPLAEVEVDGPITADDLKAALRMPFEVELTEHKGRVILSRRPDSGMYRVWEAEARDNHIDRRFNSQLSLHTHFVRSDGLAAETVSMQDIGWMHRVSDSTPVMVVHDNGIAVFRKPTLDLNGNPINADSRPADPEQFFQLWDGFLREKGLSNQIIMEMKYGQRPMLDHGQQIEFAREFTQRTGMVVARASFDEPGIEDLLNKINLAS